MSILRIGATAPYGVGITRMSTWTESTCAESWEWGCSIPREFENVAILVAIAVNGDGYREVLGAAEGMKEDKASWVSFFQWLRSRGLDGVKLVVGDKCLGMCRATIQIGQRGKRREKKVEGQSLHNPPSPRKTEKARKSHNIRLSGHRYKNSPPIWKAVFVLKIVP